MPKMGVPKMHSAMGVRNVKRVIMHQRGILRHPARVTRAATGAPMQQAGRETMPIKGVPKMHIKGIRMHRRRVAMHARGVIKMPKMGARMHVRRVAMHARGVPIPIRRVRMPEARVMMHTSTALPSSTAVPSTTGVKMASKIKLMISKETIPFNGFRYSKSSFLKSSSDICSIILI
ncbi:MAG: hypothetical protein EF806_04595 [Candidatus Methanoliparum thermophilum]|uniref:Uncharacterized protein n=2 Tax=Candidatus Methanoliparum TaxID=2545692 RepID=A0A520KS49_METT2|nr:MAG: hypothetical protein EF806_04595 [Candidatus Methanoliparum thermophilum]